MPSTPRLFWLLFAVLVMAFWVGPTQADTITTNFFTDNKSPNPGNAANGFTSTGRSSAVSIYPIPGGFGVAFLVPPVPSDALSLAPAGGSDAKPVNFNNVLQTTFQGPVWQFANGGNLAANSFVVTADQIHQTQNQNDYVGIETDFKTTGGFAVQLPAAKIPANAGATHWIQVIVDNHKIPDKPGGGHGILENIVDNGGRSTPFYDAPGVAADATNFLDASARNDPQNFHYWFADVYLASIPDATLPTHITLYNGIFWGWVDIPFSVNNLFGLAQLFDQDLSSVAALDAVLGIDLTAELTPGELQTIEADFNADLATMIPEPSAVWLFAPALLVVSIGVVQRKWRAVLRPFSRIPASEGR
jgi:hypothetical protein